MNKKTVFSTLFLLTSSFFMAIPAYANSSWHWISQTRPLDILPIVIIITLVIEILAIKIFAKVDSTLKTVFVTVFANLVSFIAPYFLFYLEIAEEESTTPNMSRSLLTAFNESLDGFPVYTVGVVFLVLTLICEMPIVFAFLRNNTKSRKRLAVVIIAVNIFTTILTAIIERTVCQGSW